MKEIIRLINMAFDTLHVVTALKYAIYAYFLMALGIAIFGYPMDSSYSFQLTMGISYAGIALALTGLYITYEESSKTYEKLDRIEKMILEKRI